MKKRLLVKVLSLTIILALTVLVPFGSVYANYGDYYYGGHMLNSSNTPSIQNVSYFVVSDFTPAELNNSYVSLYSGAINQALQSWASELGSMCSFSPANSSANATIVFKITPYTSDKGRTDFYYGNSTVWPTANWNKCIVSLKYNLNSYGSDQVNFTITHEIGHCLGLDHASNAGRGYSFDSVMWPSNDADHAAFRVNYPSSDDIDQIFSLYE